MNLIKNILIKNKELVFYGIFGALTTALNIISYIFFNDILNISYLISNALAWCIAFLFAYITNKKIVFESNTIGRETLREFISFFSCRILTGIADMFLIYLFISIIGLNDMISKFMDNIIIILLNFILSKFLIFNRKRRDI